MTREKLYVRSIVTSGLLEFIQAQGGDLKAMRRVTTGEDIFPKDNNTFISWNAVCAFFEAAAQHLKDPQFGLKSGLEQPDDFHTSGPNILLAMTVKNVREFADLAIKYQKIHTNSIIYSYTENPQTNDITGRFILHPLSPPCPQYSEHIVGIISQMGARNLPDFHFKKIKFQHEPLSDPAWYAKKMGCPVEFNAENTEFTFAADVFSIQLAGKLRFGQPLLRAYLNHQLSKDKKYTESMEMTVNHALLSTFGIQKTDLDSVAGFLELNPKKLQRLLKDEGTSFSRVLEDTRKSIAERQLRDTDISIKRLACMLDYGSVEAFSVAARRWFGTTPRKYRNRLRAEKPQ
ncbi:MAG: AraC family transcriptional regulator ligand-binding domain-containing protein [Litorimonas sp.]